MVEERLQPTTVSLRKYGGEELDIVRQISVNLTCGSHSFLATVQVQAAAPAALLIGTDVLPHLGFQLLQKDDTACQDLLQDRKSSNRGTQVQPQEVEIDSSVEEPETTVRLLQATRLPPRHAKLVRLYAQGDHVSPVSLFLPGSHESVQIQESVVELDNESSFIALVENHTCWPVSFDEGDVLGTLQEAHFPDDETVDHSGYLESKEGNASSQSPQVAKLEPVKEQPVDRIQQLREALRMNHEYLTEEEQQHIEGLVLEYQDVFSLDAMELGATTVVSHSIDTGEHPPIKQPARRTPFILRRKIEDLTKQMLDAGVIQPSKSPWASPVVLVQKKDGTHRFCVDYRRLNAATKMDVFPLPRINDTLDLLAHTKYFTTLDLAAGYWQVQMEPDSQEKTAFTTRSGLYEFIVMPFGLCNAPATFQRLMEVVLTGIAREQCLVYLDDVLVTGHSFEEHLTNLRKVFERLRMAGLMRAETAKVSLWK